MTEKSLTLASTSEFLLDGVYTPSISITDARGEIDYRAWRRHIDHLIDAGINGVLLFGSIGEFFAFSLEQKIEAIETLSQHIAGRTQLLVGVSSTQLSEALRLAQAANEANADAVLSLPPYYFAPSDKATLRYYDALANAAEAPLVLYNFPTTTGKDLTGPLVAELVKSIPAIQGIKDTVDTASHTRIMIDCVREVNPHFSVLSGFDEYYITNRIEGGNGCLTGLTNVVPELFAHMNKAWLAGNMDQAVADAKQVSRLMAIYPMADSFISAIKAAVKAQGLEIATAIQEPASQIDAQQEEAIASFLKEVLR